MIIAVDFDGTISMAGYPNCGIPNVRLIDELKAYQRNGAKLILWTCREGQLLDDAIAFCRTQGLEFDKVNDNLDIMIEKYGGNSRKVYADYYIDNNNKPLPERKKHGLYEQAKVEVF